MTPETADLLASLRAAIERLSGGVTLMIELGASTADGGVPYEAIQFIASSMHEAQSEIFSALVRVEKAGAS